MHHVSPVTRLAAKALAEQQRDIRLAIDHENADAHSSPPMAPCEGAVPSAGQLASAPILDRGEGLADGAAGGCFEDSRRDARRGVIGIFAASGTCRQALFACNEWQELLRLPAKRVNFFGR